MRRYPAFLCLALLAFATSCRAPLAPSDTADVSVTIAIPASLARAAGASASETGAASRFVHPDTGYVVGTMVLAGGTELASSAARASGSSTVTLSFDDVPLNARVRLTVDLYDSEARETHLGHIEKDVDIDASGAVAGGTPVAVAPVARDGYTLPLGDSNGITIEAANAGSTMVFTSTITAAGTCRVQLKEAATTPLDGVAVYDASGAELSYVEDPEFPHAKVFKKTDRTAAPYYIVVTLPAGQQYFTLDLTVKASITYDPNGGSGTAETFTRDCESPFELASAANFPFTRSGYSFVGWALSPDALEPDYAPTFADYVLMGDTTLYAVWDDAWGSVACDETGQYVVAASAGAGLWSSDDFGATWTQSSADTGWIKVIANETGTAFFAAKSGSFNTPVVYRSVDKGRTWIEIKKADGTTASAGMAALTYSGYNASAAVCTTIACSPDGGFLFVGSGNYYRVNMRMDTTSFDYLGMALTINTDLDSIASAVITGGYQMLVGLKGSGTGYSIFYTYALDTNAVNLTTKPGLVSTRDIDAGTSGAWTSLAVDDGATIFIAAKNGAGPYAAVWNGSLFAWTLIDGSAPTSSWSSVALNDDGTLALLGAEDGYIVAYTLSSGALVSLVSSQVCAGKAIQGIACSDDASVIVAVSAGAGIWRSTDKGATWNRVLE